MKLVTFLADDSPRIGAIAETQTDIIDLKAGVEAMQQPSIPNFCLSMLDYLKGGADARRRVREIVDFVTRQHVENATVPLDQVQLLSPVPQPESVRDCMAFEQHIINCIRLGMKKYGYIDKWIEKKFGRKWSFAYRLNRAWYERPIYYKSNRFSVVGTDSPVYMPAYTRLFDYELEWGIFICKEGKNISKEDAHDYIGGYTIFNDFSARDIQMREMGGRLGPAKGKDFDTGNAIGPFLVTPDEITEPYNLTMTARVNGEERSRGTTGDMYWTFEDIIAYISQSETLYPGEFIGSGTCSGTLGCGCGLELGKFLKKEDCIELEVEGIGVLRNTVK